MFSRHVHELQPSPGPHVSSAVCGVIIHALQQGFIHTAHVSLTHRAVRTGLGTHSYSYTHPEKQKKTHIWVETKQTDHDASRREIVNFRSGRYELQTLICVCSSQALGRTGPHRRRGKMKEKRGRSQENKRGKDQETEE